MDRSSDCAALTGDRSLTDGVLEAASALGFDLYGVASLHEPIDGSAFNAWLSAGYHAGMDYMARDPWRRLDPNCVLPSAHSCIVVGMNYYQPAPADADNPRVARFARFALGDDYHDVLKARLKRLGACMAALSEGKARWRAVVDTAPALERELARRAGLGFFGRSSMLISPRIGSYFVIGLLLTDALLTPSSPAEGTCGRCTRCMDACPTGAIVRPYVVDARRCLAYHTIESRKPIPDWIAERMGNRIFGCDVCQEVCPYNAARARPTRHLEFLARKAVIGWALSDVSRLSEEDFERIFAKSAVGRARRAGLVRSAEAALSACQTRSGHEQHR